ncbi:MAG: leucine-rich repeat domain-containing protein, partial [Lachnospiraceae bacterium]|nr:leucine-rich repeat domain-containing protein [Lachnospiraceae bacterium]
VTQCTVYSGGNIGAQNYKAWAATVKSYLVKTADGGFMRFQSAASVEGYLVEYYDAEYNLVKTVIVDEELSIFGAFYETDENYYVLSGQKNAEESDEVEVYRITKYDKSWKRLASCGLYGANTYIPFDAGSARMTDSGKYLLIRTCHEMYISNDGYHHQANVTIQVDTETMKVTDSYTEVANSGKGYVSHSFNQFIRTENNKIVAVDHGDAYPRSIVLLQYSKDFSDGSFNGSCTVSNIVEIPGEVGANYTGYSVGGFEISDSAYIVAGNEDINGSSSGGRNIFVVAQDKETGTISKHMITDYAEGSSTSIGVSTPHLVAVGNDSYMLLWSTEGKTYYARIDGTGSQVGDIYSMVGELSDCVPLVSGDKLVWYTWNKETVTFYSISLNELAEAETVQIVNGHQYVYGKPDENYIVTKTCTACGNQESFYVPVSVTCWWKREGSNYYYASYEKRYDTGYQLPYMVNTNFSDNADDSLPQNGEFEVISSDESVVSVDSAGRKLNMKSAGLATVTIRPKYNPDASKYFVFRSGAEGEIGISQCDITLSQDTYVYSGSPQMPEVTLTYKGNTLTEGTDYTVSAVNNTDVGEAVLTVTGAGIFGGSAERKFTITENTSFPDDSNTEETGSTENTGNTEETGSTENTGGTGETGSTEDTGNKKDNEQDNTQNNDNTGTEQDNTSEHTDDGKDIGAGDSVVDKATGTTYKVIRGDGGSLAVEFSKAGKNIRGTLTIPATVTVNRKKYKVTSIAVNACKNNKKLTKVIIGSNVTKIGKSAFSGCTKLKTVKLGQKLQTIGDKAFYQCKALTSITIPGGVSKIGKSAFEKCSKLQTVTIKTKKLTKARVGAKAFKGIKAKAVIKVPAGKYAAYKKLLRTKGVGKKAVFKKLAGSK